MAKRVILIRHGETKANSDMRYVGWADPSLNEAGVRQAGLLSKSLNAIKPNLILTSPLKRTKETADISAGGLDVDIVIDEDLKEVDFGEWENLTYREISQKHHAFAKKWIDGSPDFHFPGGESMKHFLARVERVNTRMKHEKVETVVAFTHGGVIGQSICHLLGIPSSRRACFALPPASITTIEIFEGMGMISGICSCAVNGDFKWAE
ncbi:hypothetical protein MNBD_NITROSPINAE02-416 [hydrothermal vent metagenome]|uniref:Histidine phosphatase family protein n=1 Tax=hydrothermal vent metagenome TaxID=652676 RepID=A0A3B1DB26_9ZZZZ